MADGKLPDEFALIRRYFAPLATDPGAAGLRDDVALLSPSPGTVHVLKTDTIVEGVHYLRDDPADLVARKLLRVNLSDLAAKGARPVGYLLAASLSRETTESWVAAFASGLALDQKEFGLSLLGGDTTATPGPTNLTVTAIGEAVAAHVPRRGGATPGDDIFVTGTLGDAALGLRVLMGTLRIEGQELLIRRFHLPEPRLALGARLAPAATASIDVSDGLIADLGHICAESGVGAEVEREALPLSAPARAAVTAEPALWAEIVAGGDDYEILLTAPPGAVISGATRIGCIVGGNGVTLRDGASRPIDVGMAGYRHF